MKDFIDKAQVAATGPASDKSKPTTSDGERANNVTRKGGALGSLKGSVRSSKPVVEYGGGSSVAPSKRGVGGSSAGLKNATSATLRLPGGGYENNSKRNRSKISLTTKAPSNPIGKTNSRARVTDHTRKGASAKENSIGRLEQRMKRDRLR